MIINEIVNESDMAAVRRLIEAHNQVIAAKSALQDAYAIHAGAARRLTQAWFECNSEERTLAETLCVEHDGGTYLITIDVDGDDCHGVQTIGGIYLEAPNG